MKSILITGSSGFVGTALKKKIFDTRFNIIETGNSAVVNFCIKDQVDQLSKADIIVHLAAKSYVPDSFLNPAAFYENNIISTLNILEKARRDRAKVIFLSTYVYGRPQYLPVDEKHPKQPLNPYTQSKILCEELCASYNRDFGVSITILRPFNVYGPGQNSDFFIPTIINQINNESIQLNDSRPKRDFIYIDDVIEAIIKSIANPKSGFYTFNVGSGISTSVKDVVSTIKNLSNSKAFINFSGQRRKGEILDTVADISKIKSVLGWEPKITLLDGLKRMIE